MVKLRIENYNLLVNELIELYNILTPNDLITFRKIGLILKFLGEYTVDGNLFEDIVELEEELKNMIYTGKGFPTINPHLFDDYLVDEGLIRHKSTLIGASELWLSE